MPTIKPFLSIPLTVSQHFGERPDYYRKYGLAGHNGLDLHAPTGTKLYSPMDVWGHLITEGKFVIFPYPHQVWSGYGAAWRLDFNWGKGNVTQMTFGHLQNRNKSLDNKAIVAGTQIAETDNTGDSSAPHLHITIKNVINGIVAETQNGFKGAIDPLPFLKDLGFKFTNA